jgi:Bacteriophage protein GP30.3
VDIHSGNGYPASALSNFAGHHFVFDGVECASMEGLLQSFKFDKPHVQESVCKLMGLSAKFRGKKRNKAWKSVQTLWWKGTPYKRDSQEYQDLLDNAYRALYDGSEKFRDALKASGDAVLTHSIGHNKESETILTEREFCSRLMRLRAL